MILSMTYLMRCWVMLSIKAKNQFKKDLQKASRDAKKDTERLKVLINDYLVQGIPIPKQYKPHLLTENWKPHMECHIQPDFLLIWDINSANNELILVRCGTHAELFG